jgi:hypothetical protein
MEKENIDEKKLFDSIVSADEVKSYYKRRSTLRRIKDILDSIEWCYTGNKITRYCSLEDIDNELFQEMFDHLREKGYTVTFDERNVIIQWEQSENKVAVVEYACMCMHNWLPLREESFYERNKRAIYWVSAFMTTPLLVYASFKLGRR